MRKRSQLLLLLFLVPLVAQEPPARSRQPNIVLILADDMGWRDAGYAGNRFLATPHLDSLARESLVFTDAYSNGPNCAPSRACLLSGQYTPRHGVYTVDRSDRGKAALRRLIPIKNKTELAESVVTFAEALKDAGYRTAVMGKWHLGNDPTTQGFDVNVGGNRSGHPKSYFSPYLNPNLTDGEDGEYLTDRLTAEAERFIGENKERPFLLYLSHYAVHTPLKSKPGLAAAFLEKPRSEDSSNPIYAGMVASLDESVGRVIKALDVHGVREDTVVIFMSDNGGVAGITSMAPKRGAKGMLYEGGVRVPLLVHRRGTIAPGMSRVPVMGTDLFPTFLELAHAAPPKDQPLDGTSLVPLLTRSGTLPERDLHWHFPAYLQGTGKGAAPFRTTPAGSLRRGRYKVIEFFEDHRLELYDLAQDEGETKNLVDREPEVAKTLHAAMVAWRRGIGAPVPTDANPKFDPEAQKKR